MKKIKHNKSWKKKDILLIQSGHTVFSVNNARSQISTALRGTEIEIAPPCKKCFPLITRRLFETIQAYGQ